MAWAVTVMKIPPKKPAAGSGRPPVTAEGFSLHAGAGRGRFLLQSSPLAPGFFQHMLGRRGSPAARLVIGEIPFGLGCFPVVQDRHEGPPGGLGFVPPDEQG